MKLMNDRYFLDSNVILYLNDEAGSLKKEKVKILLQSNPFISSQVIFECLNVCLRKFKYPKEKAILFVKSLFKTCTILNEEKETCLLAIELFAKHQLQVYDSKIIASALDAGCVTLFSEDLQNGLVINNKLTIINPFLEN
ncbi:PIN domain-containing protein [Parasediminibacterium sp. JCM 36343]|uniref:PIN domain-containing protein n=1 Tax=Parasediminibacterium sp. JCM 36343 TaxID=3374279 RepID=UPI003978BDB8